ncbi:hypothetical protein Vretimale_25 [Volvox reticuliferus]|uniref:CoA-binding domain-containing protein n=2 Tax=Volvox reticuliferus TaxID=1737510 RepID=A0A8J4D119_9CHLO|nr:hypothetical protein Vretimale_25 [Volvox reticuliferus]
MATLNLLRNLNTPRKSATHDIKIFNSHQNNILRRFKSKVPAMGDTVARSDWTANLITSNEEAARLATSFKTVAVLGIKTERQGDQPAFYVPQYLSTAGVKVIPVPVYFPEVKEILGQPVFRSVAAAAEAAGAALDCVNVFRRPADVEGHVQDVLAAQPRVVWLQSGIRCPKAEEAWARAGIQVVADKCLMVLHRQGVAARL